MKMDFTLQIYQQLLQALKNAGYTFQPFVDFLNDPQERVVILRHDVDRLPENSLRMALIEHEMDISGTYFFRSVPSVYKKRLLKKFPN